MIFNVKQAIIDRLRATKRENIETVIDYMEKYGFFTYHCHRHHHYDGGLADHAWQTYQIAQRLDAERCANNPKVQQLDDDSLAICTLLHDICDCSGMQDVGQHQHGKRSSDMLKALGFKLNQQEFLAVRFHMSLKDKTTHPLYDDAKKSQLRCLIHKADGLSAKLLYGHDEPIENKTLYYLQNITKLDCKDIIFQVQDGWFMNLHSPYDGEVSDEYKSKIIGVKRYNTADLYGINDCILGAIYILSSGDKKALFILHHGHGMQGGCYFSPDKVPFIYSEINVYSDWNEWNDFGYITCKQDNGWKLVKVTQFPTPNYEALGEGFSSAEEAMKSIGIDDSERHISKWLEYPDAKQDEDDDFSPKLVSALETIGITVVDCETHEKMQRGDLIEYLNDNMENEIMENTDFSGIDALKLKVVAVNNEHNAILYEEYSGIEGNGCNTLMLKEFFPNYQYDFYKQYFIRINGEFYDGDEFERYIYDHIEP